MVVFELLFDGHDDDGVVGGGVYVPVLFDELLPFLSFSFIAIAMIMVPTIIASIQKHPE